MAKLRGAIFGVDGILCDSEGSINSTHFDEMGRLVRFLTSRNVTCVFISNRRWTVKGSTETAQQSIENKWGISTQWETMAGDNPAKQTGKALDSIRDKFSWKTNETVFIGNTKSDMLAAVNGSTLLLMAKWYGQGQPYGFPMQAPKDGAAFVDTFCLREFPWFMQIESDDLRYYTLGPYATRKDQTTKEYSEDFYAHIKREIDDPSDFWVRSLCAGLYFNGQYADIDYVCSYPKHAANEWPVALSEQLRCFATCFRGKYLLDLVRRHKTAPEAKKNRNAASHVTQINTIHLTELPKHLVKGSDEKQYKHSPLAPGKTVLLLDDVCTEGYSLEAGRAFIQSTGAKVICASLLKTVNTDYHQLSPTPLLKNPFAPALITETPNQKVHRYGENVANRKAPDELLKKMTGYRCWEWPAE